MSKIARSSLHNDNAGKRRMALILRDQEAKAATREVLTLFEELAECWTTGAVRDDTQDFSADHVNKGVSFHAMNVEG